MSMISNQIEEMKRYIELYEKPPWGREVEGTTKVLRNAIETIESLSAKLNNQNLYDGWIPVKTHGLPGGNEHRFRMFVTIEYENGFRRTLESTWDYYGKCFKYKNGVPISVKVIAYKYHSLPNHYEGD